MQATLQVFSRRGFHRMTMENVIVEAKISRPTLYKYFNSKYDLVATALMTQALQTHQLMLAAAPHDLSLHDTAQARLEAYYDWCTHHDALSRQIYREAGDQTSPVEKARSHFLDLLAEFWTHKLAQHGLAPRDALEIDGLLRAMEHLSMRFSSLSDEIRVMEKERYIASTLAITSAYISQLQAHQ